MRSISSRALLFGVSAFAVLLLVQVLGSPAQASSNNISNTPANEAQVRVAHLSPGTGGADVWVTPAKGARSEFAHDVTYGGVTPYAAVPPGIYNVQMYPTGTSTGKPVLQGSIALIGGQSYTVAVTGPPTHLVDHVVNDSLVTPSASKVSIRLVQASTNVGSPNISVKGGPLLVRSASYGTVTSYATVGPGTWHLVLSTHPKHHLTVTLAGGSVNTVVLLNSGSLAKAKVVVDSSAAPATPVSPAPPSTPPASTDTVYVVKSGDCLWLIIEGLNPSASQAQVMALVQQTAAANHLANPSLIYPGQSLSIP